MQNLSDSTAIVCQAPVPIQAERLFPSDPDSIPPSPAPAVSAAGQCSFDIIDIQYT